MSPIDFEIIFLPTGNLQPNKGTVNAVNKSDHNSEWNCALASKRNGKFLCKNNHVKVTRSQICDGTISKYIIIHFMRSIIIVCGFHGL